MNHEEKMWKCNCGCINDTGMIRCERCNREKAKGIDVIITSVDNDYKELVDRKNNRDCRKRRKYDGSK